MALHTGPARDDLARLAGPRGYPRVLDGVLHDTTKMTAEELISVASGAIQQQLTLLQPSLTPDLSHAVTWPMNTSGR